MTLSGSVYPEFDRQRHLVDYRPDPALPVIAGLDFGFRWPSVVYAQKLERVTTFGGVVAPAGSLVVFAEDHPDDISTDALALRIAQRFPEKSSPRLSWIACDPAGALISSRGAAESSGLTDVSALRRGLSDGGLDGVRIRYVYGPGSGAIRGVNSGIEKVRARLQNGRGETRLFFSKALEAGPRRGLLRAIQSFAYRSGSSIPMRGHVAGQVDHAMDALRYLVRHIDMAHARVEQWV